MKKLKLMNGYKSLTKGEIKMLGAIFNNAQWAMTADVVVIWFLCIGLFICKYKEWKEEES